MDMAERTMMVTLNGEVLFNDRGSELAAKDFDIRDGERVFDFIVLLYTYYPFLKKVQYLNISMQLKFYLSCLSPYFPGLLPVVSVGVNQVGRLNLGRQVGSLQYFTVCGLQEGYQPFAVNMARDPALWMSWKQPQFTSIMPDDNNLQVNLAVYRVSFT